MKYYGNIKHFEGFRLLIEGVINFKERHYYIPKNIHTFYETYFEVL